MKHKSYEIIDNCCFELTKSILIGSQDYLSGVDAKFLIDKMCYIRDQLRKVKEIESTKRRI